MNKKIFVGPIEIAGYSKNLALGFSELGYSCDHISFEHHKYEYSSNENLPKLIKLSRIFKKHNKILHF